MDEINKLKSNRRKAKKLKKQLIEVYRVLEEADYSFAKDRMVAEYMVMAKRSLEAAINDYLLNDDHWKLKLKQHE